MGKVQAQAIMSLDGYVAKQDNSIGSLFDWLQSGDVAIPTPAHDFTVHLTPLSAEHWRQWVSSLGALVCGRTLFDVPRAGRDGTPLDVRPRRPGSQAAAPAALRARLPELHQCLVTEGSGTFGRVSSAPT